MDVVKEKIETYTSFVPERGYEELYSKAGILYFRLDSKAHIVSCNVTAQEKLGFDSKKLVGKSFLSLVDESDRRSVENVMHTCLVRGYVKDFNTRMTDSGDRSFRVRMSGLTECDLTGNPDCVRMTVQDVSEAVIAEKRKDASLKIAGLLRGKRLSKSLAEEILSEIQKLTGSDGIGLFFKQRDGDRLVIGNWPEENPQSDLDSEYFVRWPIETWDKVLRICRGLDGSAFSRTGSFWTGSLSDLVLAVPSGEEKDRLIALAEFESFVIVPILSEEEITGYFAMGHRKGRMWDESDVAFLEECVQLFSNGIDTVEESAASQGHPISSVLDIPVLGILIVRDGIIQSVNPWIEDFLGATKDEIEGRSLLEFIDENDRDGVKQLSNHSASDADVPKRCDAVVMAKNDLRRTVECGCTVLSSNGNSVEMWFWIDKEDRQRLKKQLYQAKKMESLGLMAGGIVHDFNNLLASILGYSSLLIEEFPKDNPYYEDIQQINRTSEKATEITSRLMAYVQGNSYVVSDLDVNQLIKEVAGILSRTLDKNISIRADLTPKILPIKADASQIQQAIFQVALNARDAMPLGGKLIFQTQNVLISDGDARLRFGNKPGNYVQVTISDTGVGMSSEVKESIFKPYFTTKDQDAGKGLGLSMVREIVENHGGSISVFSEQSKGTVFKMFLPTVEQEAVKSHSISEEKLPLGKETILLVDNERVLRETARKILTRYGYKVISTDSGTEAIAIYKKYASRIDMVILDVGMPDVGIKKVITWLKKLNPRVKIVATSDLREMDKAGAEVRQLFSGFIQKPFQVRPLLEGVGTVLNS